MRMKRTKTVEQRREAEFQDMFNLHVAARAPGPGAGELPVRIQIRCGAHPILLVGVLKFHEDN